MPIHSDSLVPQPSAEFSPKREIAFREAFAAARDTASDLLPAMLTHRIGFEKAVAYLEDDNIEPLFLNATLLYLGLPSVIEAIGNHSLEREHRLHLSRYNAALKEVILGAEKTKITRNQLIGTLMKFCDDYELIAGHQRLEAQRQLSAQTEGMWHEQSLANLLYAGDLHIEEATTDQDLHGADFYVEALEGVWIKLDAKSSTGAMQRAADKSGHDLGKITLLPEQTADNSRLVSLDVANYMQEKIVASVRFTRGRPQQLAPVDFRGFTGAPECTSALKTYIQKEVPILKTYKQADRLPDGSHRFILSKKLANFGNSVMVFAE